MENLADQFARLETIARSANTFLLGGSISQDCLVLADIVPVGGASLIYPQLRSRR